MPWKAQTGAKYPFGAITSWLQTEAGGGFVSDIAFEDLNADGFVDVIVAADRRLYFFPNSGSNTWPSLVTNHINVNNPFKELNEAIDHFGALLDLATTTSSWMRSLKMSFGDLNGDGAPDLVLGDSSGRVYLITNAGDPSQRSRLSDVSIAGCSTNAASVGATFCAGGCVAGAGGGALPTCGLTGAVTDVQNVGSTANKSYSHLFNGSSVGTYASPALIDIDDDGLLDVTVGGYNSSGFNRLRTRRNAGLLTTPSFPLEWPLGSPDNPFPFKWNSLIKRKLSDYCRLHNS
jgi:hypothetical protein